MTIDEIILSREHFDLDRYDSFVPLQTAFPLECGLRVVCREGLPSLLGVADEADHLLLPVAYDAVVPATDGRSLLLTVNANGLERHGLWNPHGRIHILPVAYRLIATAPDREWYWCRDDAGWYFFNRFGQTIALGRDAVPLDEPEARVALRLGPSPDHCRVACINNDGLDDPEALRILVLRRAVDQGRLRLYNSLCNVQLTADIQGRVIFHNINLRTLRQLTE